MDCGHEIYPRLHAKKDEQPTVLHRRSTLRRQQQHLSFDLYDEDDDEVTYGFNRGVPDTSPPYCLREEEFRLCPAHEVNLFRQQQQQQQRGEGGVRF